MAVQAENPDFSFLYEVGSPDHAYYRWRLFSLASGDSMRSWRVEPFELVEGGPKCAHPSGLALGLSIVTSVLFNMKAVAEPIRCWLHSPQH